MTDHPRSTIQPRYLGRIEAASYLGVSPNTFDAEVADGTWPPAMRRGQKGGRLTWDRKLLDAWADRRSGLSALPAQAASDAAGCAEATVLGMINAAPPPSRSERRQASAR